jgi:hypothetical protein
MVVYGPYVSKEDGRSRCVIVHENGHKQTISYPRMLVESYLGVSLADNEDVHHIDGDVSNNDISNLEVVLKSQHVREHSIKYKEDIFVPCYYCGINITLTPAKQSQRSRDKSRGKVGPFCSRRCSGKYGADVQRAAKKGLLG